MSGIITKIRQKNAFFLGINLRDGNGTEFMDENLPLPNARVHMLGAGGVVWWWLIDGWPGTKKSEAYFNDIIARFFITFRNYKPERIDWPPRKLEHWHTYKLSQFQNLQSIPTQKYAPRRADNFEDYTFWAIKMYVEDAIRRQGEGLPIVYDNLEQWAMRNFLHKKERSTIRAKCRSVWFWYLNRGWTLPETTKRSYTMSRTEHIKKVHANKKAKTRAAINSVINDIFIQEQIRTKGGRIKAKAVADILKISEKTVRTHLREMGL